MAKKGFFERLGLVESTSNEISTEELSQYLSQNQGVPQVDVQVNPESFSGLISVEEIYTQAELNDLSKSIFKANEFNKALPDSMATDVKRQSVLGILAASGLEVEALKNDASQRIGALNSVLEQFSQQTNFIVQTNEQKIAELTAEIDRLKNENNDRKTLQEKQEKLVEEEVTRIENIVKFLG